MHKSSKKNLYRQQNQIGKRRSINIVFTADKKQECKTSGCYCEEHPDFIRYYNELLRYREDEEGWDTEVGSKLFILKYYFK